MSQEKSQDGIRTFTISRNTSAGLALSCFHRCDRVLFTRPVVSASLWPHGLQHARSLYHIFTEILLQWIYSAFAHASHITKDDLPSRERDFSTQLLNLHLQNPFSFLKVSSAAISHPKLCICSLGAFSSIPLFSGLLWG